MRLCFVLFFFGGGVLVEVADVNLEQPRGWPVEGTKPSFWLVGYSRAWVRRHSRVLLIVRAFCLLPAGENATSSGCNKLDKSFGKGWQRLRLRPLFEGPWPAGAEIRDI